MGLFEDIGNWFEQAVEDVGDAFEDAGEWVEQAAEDVGEWVEQAAQDVGEVVVDVVTGIGEAAEDVAEWTLNVLDDTVFDTVDFLTGGVIDVDYDDGQFSAGLDIGIAAVGVSFGEQGFSAGSSFDVGLASGEISYDSDDGFAMSGSIGAEWLPLPYAEGHMSFGSDGTISIGGSIQGTLPLPFGGEIGGELSGGFERNADGSWGATADLEFDASSRLTGDLSIDASGTIGRDADGDLFREGEADVFIDRDRDGVDDRDDDNEEFDDLVAGGMFGGKRGQVDAGDLERSAGAGESSAAPAGDGDGDSGAIMANLGKAADSYRDILTSTSTLGLESEPTRPAAGTDGTDDLGLDPILDFVSPPPVGPGGHPTMDAAPVDPSVPPDAAVPGYEFGDDRSASTAEFAGVDPLAAPPISDPTIPDPSIPDMTAPEPILEPEPSDFAVEIEAIDNVEASTDDMWEDLG